MLGTSNRNIKILGAAWLALGGLAFAIALVGIALNSSSIPRKLKMGFGVVLFSS